MKFIDKLISYYALTSEEFSKLTKPINELDISQYGVFSSLAKAKEVIFSAINNHEKIAIYGDYDCDGIMATSILVKAFKLLNYEVGYYIPSRYIDGYGLNCKRVEDMHQKGYRLIITVDNGISQYEAIELANKLGIKIILTDHHEVKDVLPSADVIVHPAVDNYGPINCCGAYVAFMLASELLGYQSEYLLTLASIATISDMMVLRLYNRDIVRLGIDFMKKNRFYALKLLCEKDEITESTFAMQIAPKVNAMGRVIKNTQVNMLVKYFTSDVKSEIDEIFQKIIESNELRRELTKKCYESLTEDYSKFPAIILLDSIEEGLIGLVANRLMDEYNLPTLILTYDTGDNNILKGSMRSKNGFDVSEFLQINAELFLTCGGHSQAGGLSIKSDRFEALKDRLYSYAANHAHLAETFATIDISIDDINEENYAVLRQFSPFGMGHNQPHLKINTFPVASLKYSKNFAHIYCSLGLKSKIIGYNYPSSMFQKLNTINLIGYFDESTFRGLHSIEYKVTRIINCENNEIITNTFSS